MPRIDPIQLLRCLSVLLSPNGGIRSNDEVHRLASLMTKFSKKLVSKCIYIQILKCTETELLGSFMGSGGWRLVHMWLTESIVAKNWPLVRELLELLLLCPVDIDILKTNNCPKLVKELSKDGSQAAIRALATKLVEQWLKTVKGEPVIPVSESDFPQIINEAMNVANIESTVPDLISESSNMNEDADKNDSEDNINTMRENLVVVDEMSSSKIEPNLIEEPEKEIEALPILKISLKDGKQVISKLDEAEQIKKTESIPLGKDDKSSKSRSRSDDGKTGSSRSSRKHSSSSRSHSSKSSSDKHRSSSKSSSSNKEKSKDRSKDSLRHSSSTDKHRDKKHSDKSHSSSSHKSKIDKTKTDKSNKSEKTKDEKTNKSSKDHQNTSDRDENEKNKETVEKLRPPPISKLMKIPKVSDALKRESPSISIETRKPNDPNRPKTVKTFNSKFRSHGLEEEAKPPPPRGSFMKKPPPTLPPTVAIPKRQSPSHNTEAPPEKKSKITEPSEKPGSIKLIPAKPKHYSGGSITGRHFPDILSLLRVVAVLLLESDMFMDALNASATNKKEPKKRKRRTSGSKDGNPSTDTSPPNTPTAAPASSSPSQETKSTPFRFYNDTLETEEEKEKEKEKPIDTESQVEIKPEVICEPETAEMDEKIEDKEPHVRTAPNGLRGVLCYHKRKGPKKSIRWRPDTELEQIQYFELDETERVNVSKTFMDMKQLERVHEREAFQKARNLINEDVMEVKTGWRPLIPVDIGGAIVVEYGKNSTEKEIQAARQKSVLQSLYLKSMIPDSPSDPEPETHTHSEPTIMPLDDVTGNPDTVSDFRNTPWPEPKGSASSSSGIPNNISMPQNMFPPMSQFPAPFPNAQFGIPGYQGPGPGMIQPGGEWQNNMPPNVMIPGGMPPGPMVQGPGPMPPVLMNPANMPPGLMMPTDRGMMGPDMFGGPGQNMFTGPGPMPPEGFPMMENINGPPQNMFPPGFPVNMVPPLPGPDNVGPFSYAGRGGMRGRGSSNQWRGGWDGPARGRGGHGQQGGWKKAKCIHFLKKGSCRQGESCAFMHPGVNCPY